MDDSIESSPAAGAGALLRLTPTLDAAAIARRFVRDNRDHLEPGVVAVQVRRESIRVDGRHTADALA